jgi:hypothetical protein
MIVFFGKLEGLDKRIGQSKLIAPAFNFDQYPATNVCNPSSIFDLGDVFTSS